MADYWTQRNTKAAQKLAEKTIKQVMAQSMTYYRHAMLQIIDRFEAVYDKLLLTTGEGKQPTPADLYKLDAYWKMQAQLAEELQKLGDEQSKLISENFMKAWNEFYEAAAAKTDLSYATINNSNIEQLIKEIWCADGKSWSERVWGNLNELKTTLNNSLVDTVVTGKKSADLKKELIKNFNVSFNKADCIVRTEVAHIQTESTKKRYQDYGVQQVEVLVDEDERTCPICAKLEGKRFPINGKMPVPAHPRCRCAIIPVIE